MNTNHRGQYRALRDWFKDVITEDVILRYTSALEYMQLFGGYRNERYIEVYALEQGMFINIDYKIIDSFENIEYEESDGIRYTTINQTINDMLRDENNADEQSLIEALENYYYRNNNSFEGLNIEEENQERFNKIKIWAIEYSMEG